MARLPTATRRQGGLTLIELLISMAIGLMVLGALLVVYLGSRAAYRSSDSLARVQESGRFAIEFIAQDSRMSGFMGCLSRSLTTDNLLNLTANPPVAFSASADGIRGFDGSSAASIALWTNPTAGTATPITRVGNSDVLTVRRTGGTAVGLRVTPPSASTWAEGSGGTVTLAHNAVGLRNSDVVVLGNCEQGVVLRVTNNPAATGIGDFPTVIEYKAAGAGSDGTQGNVTTVPDASRVAFTSASRAEVIRFVDVSYFIGLNAAGRPSLFRAAGGAVEELVDNIEDMDIVYGVDTTLPDADGTIDAYLRADQVADWSRVVSARISLLVVGPEDNVATDRQTYTFREMSGDGVADAQTAADRRLRHVFTTTVSLRNRVL